MKKRPSSLSYPKRILSLVILLLITASLSACDIISKASSLIFDKTTTMIEPTTTMRTMGDVSIDQKLDSTGLLEGYNVVTIMVETGMYDFVSEEFTPTLYGLMKDGLNFSNNYSNNDTGVSELIAIFGSFSKSGITYNYSRETENCIYDLQIDMPYSLPKMLGNSYYKSFFHDGAGLYARDSLMGQIGFDSWKHEFYSVHPSGTKRWDFNGSYEMDSDYLNIVLGDMYRTDKNFYTFWTTLSTHGPYEAYTNSDKNIDAFNDKLKLFEDRGYKARIDECFESVYGDRYDMDEKYYSYLEYIICAMMDLDNAVKALIDKLKEEGLFDKTLFVIYGDHEAYYHKSATNTGLAAAMSNAENSYDSSQYHTLMVFYNETLTKAYRNAYGLGEDEECKIDVFTSPYIIVPTILDLLGIEYDEDYYYSKSFFKFDSVYDGISYTNKSKGFYTDGFFYGNDSEYLYEKIELLLEEKELIESIISIKTEKMDMISDLYENVWFSYKTK